ncbi:hypothetical protein QE385_002950 [Sphingomonas sp. SORGH_AS 950]|uniref:STAS/SEC14 domain-containing protein n=1 Tax=unclassified Sphingomonas TaxID=196159 RepID=UPI0027866A27|nr:MULTISPECIES: STAS/SEC14 domain-containing protein [unclassified Sphingomonas]MDQ1158623.1 hypothetical protein [Sphingomonas sp. SORGH_AS_0950]MDR6145356.1 hypothetical protein [Sphingomonas sp. SORGH_AS_0870]
MYAFDFHHDINLLDIRWTGLFTPEIAARYAHELTDAFWRSGFVPGYLLRVDMSVIRVQPSDSVMVVHNNMRNFPRARRIGMVTNSAIARQQILRLMKQPYLRIFETSESALEWLVSPEESLA